MKLLHIRECGNKDLMMQFEKKNESSNNCYTCEVVMNSNAI